RKSERPKTPGRRPPPLRRFLRCRLQANPRNRKAGQAAKELRQALSGHAGARSGTGKQNSEKVAGASVVDSALSPALGRDHVARGVPQRGGVEGAKRDSAIAEGAG